MIKILFKDSTELEMISYTDLEKRLNLRYIKSLKFQKETYLGRTLKQSKKSDEEKRSQLARELARGSL